jgi:hypothetical protein
MKTRERERRRQRERKKIENLFLCPSIKARSYEYIEVGH